MVKESGFNYDAKTWGVPPVRLSPTYIQALKLKYCLEDLAATRGRVLDVGCGGGNMPKAIRHYRPDLEVWGTDLSMRSLRAGLSEPDGVRFGAARGERLPFSNGAFDAVTMFDVLEHLKEPDAALREVHRVLRPGGLFHLFLPLENQPFTVYAMLRRLGWRAKELHCGHIHFYSDRECRDQMSRAGFRVAKPRWSFHPFLALVDVAYFSLLALRGRPVSTSVEGYIHCNNGKPTPAQRFVGYLKNLLVAVGYYESRFLSWLPGGGGHFSAVKRAE